MELTSQVVWLKENKGISLRGSGRLLRFQLSSALAFDPAMLGGQLS